MMLGNPPSKTIAYDWQSLARAMSKAYLSGDFAKAEDLAWEGLSKAKLMGEFEPRLAISLSNLAVIQRMRGQRDRAEDLSNIALRILQAVDSRGQLMVKALINSACFYHDQGRWGEARRLYSRALTLLEKAASEDLLAEALCLYARLCSDQSKYSQAETLLKRVGSLSRLEPEQQLLFSLTYAVNSIRQQRLGRAEQLLAECDEVLLKGQTLQLMWKSSLLSVRGELLAAQYEASRNVSGSVESDIVARRRAVTEAYEHALDIREQTLGPFHPACADVLRKMAEFEFLLSDYENCEKNLRKALSISLSSRGPYHLETNRLLELSAMVLRATNRHDEAESVEERSRQVEKRVREIARETYVVWGEQEV